LKDLINKAKNSAGQIVEVGSQTVSKGAKRLNINSVSIKRGSATLIDGVTDASKQMYELGKGAIKTDLAKDAAAGAAIGAAIALPLPIVGPALGAAVGAGLGLYKNISQGPRPQSSSPEAASKVIEVEAKEVKAPTVSIDKYEELEKLFALKEKGVLTDEEFSEAKQKILAR